jgi:hypothetical protein
MVLAVHGTYSQEIYVFSFVFIFLERYLVTFLITLLYISTYDKCSDPIVDFGKRFV